MAMRFARAWIPLVLLLAACGGGEDAPVPDAPSPPADATPAGAEARYATLVVGRWGAGPACDGPVWTFRAGGLSAPGGISCSVLNLGEGTDGPGGALRAAASDCTTGPLPNGDIVLDLTPGRETLRLAGVYMAPPEQSLRRCAGD